MSDLDPRLNAFREGLADARLKDQVAAPRYVEGRPAGVARGVVDLRRAPDAASGLDTQLLFGESVRVFDEAGGWAWVQSETDGYVGYLESAALGPAVGAPTHRLRALRSFLYPEPNLKAPALDCLSIASPVQVIGEQDSYSQIAGGGWLYSKHLQPLTETSPDFVATALEFLGTPYFWGGRSSIGLDCSTLVQLSLACAGMNVRRDSYQQAGTLGEALNGLPGEVTLERGDLVYSPGHVAIMLDAGHIVHANGFTMTVAVETLGALEKRVLDETKGTGFTTVRRVSL
ncbi:C40 family peptidase [Pelagibius marinus]|uniref:C40 family peptidase n=1 Tax=Pelagibius marinus TaxID=2762760 RepID=UPI0018729C87|nr:NlpC/P60 family protein [Pelagibius marinus]